MTVLEREGRRRSVGILLSEPFIAGVLIAGVVLSILLLPSVVADSDFRVVRRVSGAGDGQVFASYGFADRYLAFNELSREFPGGEFLIDADAWSGWNITHLVLAYGGGGSACSLDPVTSAVLTQSRAVENARSSDAASFRWEILDRRSGTHYRISAASGATRFVVLATGDLVEVIDADLFSPPLGQRCATS